MTSRAGQALRQPRTKTGNWLISGDGLDPEALSYHDVTGDPIDLREMVCRIEDEAQSMRWPAISSSSATETQDGEWPDDRVALHRQGGHAGATNPFCPLCNPRPDEASIAEIAAGISELGTGGTPAFIRGYNRGYDDAYEHAATPTPDDRDREVERIKRADCTCSSGKYGGSHTVDCASRKQEQIAQIDAILRRQWARDMEPAALYVAGLRASGGNER